MTTSPPSSTPPPPSRTEREELARALLERERRRREHPLRYAELWHRDPPRTSQRRVAMDLRATNIVLGGNRTGKTEVGAMLSVAHALGGDHPDVAGWCARNGLDATTIPRGPGRVCASALTSADSMRYQRAKLDGYLPAGTRWRNREGQGEASAHLPGGGVILCKSNDQGPRSYQGDSWRFLWADEEHDADVWREGTMRLLDQRGRLCATMTPLLGLTYVYDLVQAARPDTAVHWLHMQDNPHLPAGEIERVLSTYGPHERAARERGEFVVLEGRVYTDWSRHLHVVAPFTPPAEWQRVAGLDFGTRNPTALVLGAIDPADDTLHVVAEYYERERTIAEHAAAWRPLFARHGEPEWIAADPEDRGSRLALAREHGIATRPARKDVRVGINAVAERLRPDANGRPHLLVHANCTHLVREVEGYTWRKGNGGDMPDAPLKQNDHLLDATRYMCMLAGRDVGAV